MTSETEPAFAGRPLVAYIDGSCIGNPGPGGYAWRLEAPNGTVTEGSAHDPQTTNNRMELEAAIALLRVVGPDKPLIIRSDSQYLVHGCTRYLSGWKAKGWLKADGKPVLNPDLWKALDDLLATGNVTFAKVAGHAGIAGNERVDSLAKIAAHGQGDPK